ESYNIGTLKAEYQMNVVLTIDRKGQDFVNFFDRLFEQVSKGETLPMAWHNVAPQVPGQGHKHIPETLAVMGAGAIALQGDL
ncbi:MAG: hypothetical protein AAFO69_09585, partial [Bacteroidota bacterium]